MKLNDPALELVESHSYTLGSPRNFQLSPDAKRLYFTRSPSSTSGVNSLCVIDLKSGKDKLLFDPLSVRSAEKLTSEDEKQRERLRETSAGITSYRMSENGQHICFALGGSLWLVDTIGETSKRFNHVSGASDPRFNFDGSMISYVTSDGVWTVRTDLTAQPRRLVLNESETEYYGRAEFIAAEEFERYRGHWWSPKKNKIVIAKVDESAVAKHYYITDKLEKSEDAYRYPAAGTSNAGVSLLVLTVGASDIQEISWNREKFPYLLNVQWTKAGLFITVQTRTQRKIELLKVSRDFKTKLVWSQKDSLWTDVLQPLPYVTDDGKVVGSAHSPKRRLTYSGKKVTPAELHVEHFVGKHKDWLVYCAAQDSRERIVYAVNIGTGENIPLSPPGGMFSAITGDRGIFVSGRAFDDSDSTRFLYSDPAKAPEKLSIAANAANPPVRPKPDFFRIGRQKYAASLLTPAGHDGKHKLPVLLDVYGGPHHQEVLFSVTPHLEKQWWADQGFAVLSIDGPGTPGRDAAWERLIHGDLISKIAKAQMESLAAALQRYPFLDDKRIASRGWSFGGYLSAFLSVLYPNWIRASISGAPVTDWKLYDTHYSERYLGGPDTHKGAYDKSSLLNAVKKRGAPRPILLIHGLQDDNVLIENSLKLTEALDKVDSPYEFIPLSGASHFTKETEQRVWLMRRELEFLKTSLDIGESYYL
jgi:dipeptidyl-peptidase 4